MRFLVKLLCGIQQKIYGKNRWPARVRVRKPALKWQSILLRAQWFGLNVFVYTQKPNTYCFRPIVQILQRRNRERVSGNDGSDHSANSADHSYTRRLVVMVQRKCKNTVRCCCCCWTREHKAPAEKPSERAKKKLFRNTNSVTSDFFLRLSLRA